MLFGYRMKRGCWFIRGGMCCEVVGGSVLMCVLFVVFCICR
jgi:hypothetical protein